MKLVEFLTRACGGDTSRALFARAVGVTLRKWPAVRFFTEEQLLEIQEELRKDT